MTEIIKKVDSVTPAKQPSTFRETQSDVSRSSAGRTAADGTMHKERIGTAVKIELAWKGLTQAQATSILQMFQPEYISVQYLNTRTMTFLTSSFYVGDRTAECINGDESVWNVSFNIIQQTPTST